MNEKEYYSRTEKINAKLSTDRCSIDEEYNLSVQKNYLSTKYIKFLENKNQDLQNRIDRTYKYVSQLSSKGRDCEIYYDIKKEILNNLKESGE